MKLVRRRGQWFVGGLMLLSAALPSAVSRRAVAQSNSAEADDAEARAQALFLEAWRLMDQQRQGDACVMFRRALELKRSPSILNNVGRCFQQENDPVSALETFESSVALAEQQPASSKRDSWIDGARREIQVLQPRVARLELELPDTPGLVVEIDGKRIAPGATYLVPGRHQLSASAPDRVSHRAELELAAGEREQYQVPALPALVVRPPVAARPAYSPPPAEGSSRVLPWALIGTGSAVVVVGAVTGLMASAKGKELERGCPDGSCPNPRVASGWQGKIDDTRQMALVTDVLWGVGLATLGAGITLLVVDANGSEPAEHAELQASCSGGGCGLGVQGRF